MLYRSCIYIHLLPVPELIYLSAVLIERHVEHELLVLLALLTQWVVPVWLWLLKDDHLHKG